MDFKYIVDKSLKSEIRGLVLDNTLIGFRVKSYNITLDRYDYYDFDTEVVKSIPNVYDFFKDKCSSFKCSKLTRKNGMLYTREELMGMYESKELLDSKDAIKVLKPVILLYKGGFISV